MTEKALRIRESGALHKKGAKGTYPITVITEGKGSSGVYSAQLLESYHHAFDNAVSFMDHPDDPNRPWERSVTRIGGRIVGETRVGKTDDGLTAIFADWKPRKEYAEFVEEYFDTLGLSIYIMAEGVEVDTGSVDDNGDPILERHVTKFDASDEYRSVDVVVAAGRGGKFNAAAEMARTIESAIGVAGAQSPLAETSAGEPEKEGNMLTKEEVQAIIAEALAPVASAVAELKTAVTEKATAEAEAEAVETAVKEALEGYDEKVQAITAEKDLLDSQRTALMESARAGEDIAPALESAKAIATEAKAAFGVKGSEIEEDGFVFESGTSTTDDDSAFLAEAAGYKEA